MKLLARFESVFLLKVLLHAIHEVCLLSSRGAAMSSEEVFQHRHRKLFDEIVSHADHSTNFDAEECVTYL